MKRNQKPKITLGHKIFFTFIILLLSPFILLALTVVIWKMLYVYQPALLKVQTVPRYWLTWKHIKLLTGLSTKNTLTFLTLFADNYFFEYRLRDDTEVEQIKKFRHRKSLRTPKEPLFSEDVIYFQFRMVWRGGRKRPTFNEIIKQLIGSMQPKPVLAPAYS